MKSTNDSTRQGRLASLDRRAFLKLGGTAGLTTLAGLPALPALPAAAGDAPGPEGFFSPREREVLTAVVERMVDTGEPDVPAVRDTRAIAALSSSATGKVACS